MTNSTINEGENVRRLRLIMGLRQSRMALKLGKDWNQQRVSYMENRRKIDISTLNHIAAVLQVPVWLLQMPHSVFNNIVLKCPKQDNFCPDVYMIKIVELYERLLISERELHRLIGELNELEGSVVWE
jgi:transcriptional regulator with XRE-family HTH domain